MTVDKTDQYKDIVYRLRVTTHRETIYDIKGATTPAEALQAAIEYEGAYILGMGETIETESIEHLIEADAASMEDEPADTLTIRNNGDVASESGFVVQNGFLWEDDGFLDDDYIEDDHEAAVLDAVLDRTPAASA